MATRISGGARSGIVHLEAAVRGTVRKCTIPGLALILPVVLVVLLAGCDAPETVSDARGGDRLGSIESGGVERTYRTHLPKSYDGEKPVPLLLAFHGGGGDGAGMERLTHLSEIADEHGFMVVYPDGVERNWNDGRPEINPGVDDVGFVTDLLAELGARYNVDDGRVYSTGISNGGFFSFRLAFDMPDKIAAIAPVAALMTEDLYSRGAPPETMPVVLIEGTDDPLVPWDGGGVGFGRRTRGSVLSAADTVSFWVEHDGCSQGPTATRLPDAEPADGTLVAREEYSGGREGSGVTLFRVEGGGHTWPGGLQYLRERAIGRTSRDFDAGEAVWEFCSRYTRN